MSFKKAALLAAGLSALATMSHSQALSGWNCPGPAHKSVSSNSAQTMTVINESNESVDVYWSDFQGNAIFYKTLHPGQSYNQPTFATHAWVFWQSNRCEYSITMPASDQWVTIR